MEKIQKTKQYEYRANSNLVLTLAERPRDIGPSGEVSSLVGKFDTKTLTSQMGDRVSHARPAELDDRIKKAQDKRREKQEEDEPKRRRRVAEGSVLSEEISSGYRPQTRETRAAYEVLLQFLQQEMGDKPHDVLRDAADEVLKILKDDGMKDREKQSDIEKLFRRAKPMDEDRFNRLYNISKKITDFKGDQDGDTAEAAMEEGKIDENLGVSVVFDEEKQGNDDDEDDLDIVKDEDDDEDDDEGVENKNDYAIEAKEDGTEGEAEASKTQDLDVHSIDAYWIQRQISSFNKDALQAQKMAEEVFGLLSSEENDGAVENKLVLALGFDQFSFIKMLMKNRDKVVYCTRLARAGDNEKARAQIEEEMMAQPKLRNILNALHKSSSASERNAELQARLFSERKRLGNRKASTSTDDAVPMDRDEAFWNKRPKAVLDLESLAFDAEGHMMANQECKLPKNSEIINKKGFQEVHIPASRPKPFDANEKLVEISSMPEWARPAFAGMKSLNRVQSKVYQTAMLSAENMLLCAPTGAGKTNVAMLTMLREIGMHRKEDGSIDLDAFKIVYVAPMKSLVQEMVANFSKRLQPYGITVKELSGDQQLTKAQINSTQVIVTTPEKWDIITRKAGERTYTQLVRLVIIDEVHLLHDARGPVLESLVSRTIRQIETSQELVRLVGLSATLPNYEDVAMFLRVKIDKGLFFFDNSFRPCPLSQQYIGVTAKKAFKRHELMNQICYEKVVDKAGKNQVLIFVHSRKETATTARMLRDMAMEKDELSKFLREESGRAELLKTEAESVKNEALKELLPYGFAIHHAGMTRADRTLVEELFADNHIQVLVSTATLAWGVNLPAQTVIIKGTQIYNAEKGRWTELSFLDVMQMLGRAGRPQYDTQGEGVILTSHKELQFYLSLLNEQLPIESQYVSKLADNLNAEIVLGTITNMKEAVQWLGYTYLYVRMLRKPALYGISYEEAEADPTLEQRRIDLIHTAATLLDKHGLVKYDRKSGAFQVTELGRVASHYYISHQSMAVYNEFLKPTMSDIELFRVFSLSSEFKHMTVREEEKLELAKLLDKVPIPVKESMEEPSAKVNVLLQTYISRLTFEGFALAADMVYITQSAGRIMRALFEIVLKRGWAAAAVKCLNLCKMVSHRMWAAQSPLRQFPNIAPEIIKRIEGKDFPWDRFYDLEAPAIGELVRFPKMGKTIHRAVHQLPKLELQGHVQPITRSVLRVELTITPDFQWDDKLHGEAEPFIVVVEDVDGETILHHESFILKKKYANDESTLNFTIPIYDPLPPQYYIRVTSERWLGSEVVLPISFRHLILPEKYPAPTELLDLQPLPITELANQKYIKFFSGRFDYFNPIQTQVFNTIYKRDDNMLLAAPTGSGKTVVAELAIMRALSQNPKTHCVYIAPMEAIATEKYKEWSAKFEALGARVVVLTGDATADVRLLADSQIAISTPQAWDVLSRRWKARKPVQEVKLMVVDELHLIGGDVGPTMEVIVSRMRYMASQLETPIRLVGLSTSVANAKDLGEWMGCTSNSIFNFHPNVRPVPLEIRVQGFDINSFSARQLAMLKPTYMSITHHSPNKPVIVFVPSRTHARSVAVELMGMVGAEEDAKRFLHVDAEDLEPHLKYVGNKALRETLMSGIGFYHAGLSDKEKAVVEKLFKAEAIQVVVVEYSLCWGLTMSAHLVVIMGTQFYDGREHRYVDCPITDVIQMMGRASRPLQDNVGKCTIMCQGSKKEFYKKFLYEPFPVESHLDHYLADHLNAEIISKRVETVHDAVDYLTWSFYYRRITQNPNYYNLQGVSHRHLSDHLSELVENTLEDLAQAKCISIDNETDLAELNFGMIAAFYYIKYTTVEKFSSSLTKASKLKGLLEVLCSASEFEELAIRHREDIALQKLAMHLPLKISDAKDYGQPNIKCNVLLQAHFSRVPLAAAVADDLSKLLPDAVRLLQAMVDVISSKGWLAPALHAMELSQMVTQGLWNSDPSLMQLPHVTKDMALKLGKMGVNSVADLMDMEDDERNQALALPPNKMQDIAQFCNNFPDIDVKYQLEDESEVVAGDSAVLTVDLEREEDEEQTGVPMVNAPRYPQLKAEGWWLVLGNPKTNELLSIKRISMKKHALTSKLEFTAPEAGKHTFMLYLMSDSYVGCDQEYEITVNVGAASMDESA